MSAPNQFESYLDENSFAQQELLIAERNPFESPLLEKLIIDHGIHEYDKHQEKISADLSDQIDDNDITEKMWTWDYIGLYAHYAGVGINGGIQGLILNFCVYYFHGATTLCPNAQAIIFLPWSFKIIYAILTDSFRPFGLRRKPYLIVGWIGVLVFTLALAVFAPSMGSSTWILLSICTMVFLMLADVPADGYSVELGKLEKPEHRGQILATGQRIRFVSTMAAGFIQAFLVNGPSTNPSTCPISMMHCWSWGLTVSQYYYLIFVIISVLFIPILYLKEPDARHIPMRTFYEHGVELWETLENRTAFSLLVYVTGTGVFASMGNIATTYMQYYVIGLTNLQAGIGIYVQHSSIHFVGLCFFVYVYVITDYMSSFYMLYVMLLQPHLIPVMTV